ncbi:MAG: ABC transporter substrate-binding protein [Burkholderiaceae bacterium]
MKIPTRLVLAALLSAGLSAAPVRAAEPLRVALIAPLSGPDAAGGRAEFAQARFVAAEVNAAGGMAGGRQIEVVAYDTRSVPEETSLQLRRAIGDGVRFYLHGGESGRLAELAALMERHNATTPNNRLMMLDYSAEALPANRRCNPWRFRFDASPESKIRALGASILASRPSSSVYLLGENTAFGNSLSLALIRYLGPRGANLAIAGNALYDPGTGPGATPQLEKVVDSGAGVLILASRGSEILSLLADRRVLDLRIPIYTFYGALAGATKAIGLKGVDMIRVVHVAPMNPSMSPAWADFRRRFKSGYADLDFSHPMLLTAIRMFAAASRKSGSTDAEPIARSLAGMRFTTRWSDEVYMRPQDQQLITPVRVSVQANQAIEFDIDNSGFGLRTEATVPADRASTDPICSIAKQ